MTSRIPVFNPAVGNHDRGTEERTQLAVALVHDFFDRCPGRRRRNRAGKQPQSAKEYQGSKHPSSSKYGIPFSRRRKSADRGLVSRGRASHSSLMMLDEFNPQSRGYDLPSSRSDRRAGNRLAATCLSNIRQYRILKSNSLATTFRK